MTKIYSSNLYRNFSYDSDLAEFKFGMKLIKNRGLAGKATRFGLKKAKSIKAQGGLKSSFKAGGKKVLMNKGRLGKASRFGFKKAMGAKKFGKKLGSGAKGLAKSGFNKAKRFTLGKSGRL